MTDKNEVETTVPVFPFQLEWDELNEYSVIVYCTNCGDQMGWKKNVDSKLKLVCIDCKIL